MIRSLFLVVFLMFALGASADTLISGTYRKGSNITEPQPQKSKYMKVMIGGFGVSNTGVRYVLNAEIYKPFKRAMYLKAEFENPQGEPFTEEAELPSGQRALMLVHGPVKGLEVGRTYWVKIYLYEVNDRVKPVDVLTQNIKSYADTTGDKIIYKTGLVPPSKLRK